MAGERRKKLILATLSVVLTLLLAEAALRILGIGAAGRGSAWFAGGNHPCFLFKPDPASGYTLRPGFRGVEISPAGEFQVTAAIDGRGLRDHPHSAPPRPVVLALGDSMTFGEGVPVGDAYPALLEKALGVRVYNGGVPGYGSPQMLGRLERLQPVLRPDAVLVTLSPYWDARRGVTPFVYKDGYIVAQSYLDRLHLINGNLYHAETRLPVLGPLTAQAKGHSNLMRLALPPLFERVHRLQEKEGASGGVVERVDPEPTLRTVVEAKRRAEQAGAGFLLILLDSDTRGDEYRQAHLDLTQELRRRGFPYVDLQELLPGTDWPRLRYPWDAHWTAEGHRVVAAALASPVRDLIGRRPGSRPPSPSSPSRP
ncbi:MAG TPA: GDSL-type esterase/lipase family protein [Thermoanaerobaculia bacterium]|nr:GDSL-type esterase/lipase family protein [Thermoanaerobaculia bacterium]